MQCQNCGADNRSPIFEPVLRKTVSRPPDDYRPGPEPFYKRWACKKCDRYHFADGSLYHYPFDDEPDCWK